MDGDWCLIGDLNMVERRIDRNGPSSTLVGTKRLTWNSFKEKWALIDVATIIGGEDKMKNVSLQYLGSFARLDRCYAYWLPHFSSFQENYSQAISDHFPIQLSLALQEFHQAKPKGAPLLLMVGKHHLQDAIFNNDVRRACMELTRDAIHKKKDAWICFATQL